MKHHWRNGASIAHCFIGLVGVLLIAFGCSCNGCNSRTIPEQIPDDAAERYAGKICEAEAACGCGRYASLDECKSDVIAAFDAATGEISNFDEECFDKVLDTIETRACADVAEVVLDCEAITGATPVGAPCERDPRLRAVMPDGTCESDATCNLGTGLCAADGSTVPTKEVGDTCVPHHLQSCGPDLYCAADSTCQTRTADDVGCTSPYECELDSFCEGKSGLCTPQLQAGETCDPADWSNCAIVWTSMTTLESSWCNPQTLQCEVGELYVCAMLDYPFVP